MEDEDRDEVHHRGDHHGLVGLEHARRDHGRDAIRRVVKAVQEVEREGDDDQPEEDPQAQLAFHHEFSRTMPSMMFATSSQRSVIDSSRS
jgi:hypothetical protein